MNENLIHNVLVDINEIRASLLLEPVIELEKGDHSCADCPILNTITKGLPSSVARNYSIQASGSLFRNREYLVWRKSFHDFILLFDHREDFDEYFRKKEEVNVSTS